MRILVTGATGFIGQHLVTSLVRGGFGTGIFVETSGETRPQLPSRIADNKTRIQTFYGDLRNPHTIDRSIQEYEPDSMVHLAAVGVTDPFLEYRAAVEHNVMGTINLVQSCFAGTDGRHRASQLIVARTPGEISTMNVYAASKAAAWSFCSMYARTMAWPIAGAFVFQAYGPGQAENALVPSAMSAALAGEDFPMTSGDQERDWVYVEDVAGGIIAALEAELAPGISIDLGTGQPSSIADVVDEIFEIAGGGGKPLRGALPDRPGEVRSQIADVAQTEHSRYADDYPALTSIRLDTSFSCSTFGRITVKMPFLKLA
jgi:nucleoside-diphosphate-sugar epimerase